MQTIPEKYRAPAEHFGEVLELQYATQVYNPELPSYGESYRKSVRVYLPYGYDAGRTYPVVYVLHGGGGDDYHDWLSEEDPSPVSILENLVRFGDARPCVLVFPNTRSDENQSNRNGTWTSFYHFAHDLRHDLIPFIEEQFSVGKTRESRAICGLSMGGFQTTQMGIGELYDLFAWYGAFSASFNGGNGMTFSVEKALDIIEGSDFDLGCFYLACGTDDTACYRTFARDVATIERYLPTCQRLIKGQNYEAEFIDGGCHNYAVWQYTFFRFLQRIFQ